MRPGLQFGIVALAAILVMGCQEEITAGPTKADFAAERNRLARQAVETASSRGQSATGTAEDGRRHVEGSAQGRNDTSYEYVALDRRDPFRSILFEMTQAAEEAPRAPLEQFELAQISLLAVVWDAVNPRALIADPGGRSFVIQQGSRLGKNEGRVVDIGDNVVLVRETYVNYAGEQTTKDIAIRVRGSQGG
jgi:Tfp pilus assembly protein PilP